MEVNFPSIQNAVVVLYSVNSRLVTRLKFINFFKFLLRILVCF